MKRHTIVRLFALSAVLLAAAWAAGGGATASQRFQRAVPTPNQFNTVPYRSNSGPGTGLVPTKVSKNVNITHKTGAQSETSIAIDPTNPNHIYAASNDLANFSTYNGIYESFDRGRTWASAGLTVNTFCYDPRLDFNSAGDIFFSYECSDQRIAYKLHGSTTWVQSGSLPAGSFPDRDMVVTDDNPGSPHFGAVYIGYDDNGNLNRAHLMISANGQGGWVESPGIDDTVSTSDVIGVNAAVGNDGTVYATWEDYAHGFIKNDVSHDGGTTWTTDRNVHAFRINTSASRRGVAPGAEEFLPPGDNGIWLPPQRTFSSLSVGRPLDAERSTHLEVGVERDLGSASTISVRAFRQQVADQLLTMFGMEVPGMPVADLGHYFVGNYGDLQARGVSAGFRTAIAGRVQGSVEYSLTRAKWNPGDRFQYQMLRLPSSPLRVLSRTRPPSMRASRR